MIRIIGAVFVLILLGAGLVAGYFALQGRVSFLPRASGNATLTLSPTVNSKEPEKYLKISVTANVPKPIKSTKIVILYDDAFLGDVKNVVVNSALGTATVDIKTKGRIMVQTANTGTAPKDSLLFSFQIKGKKITPESGSKISVLLKKSSIKDTDKIDMLDTNEPVESIYKVVSSTASLKPPVCSGITLTPALGNVGETITARLTATPTDKPLKSFIFTFDKDGSQTVNAGEAAKHVFTLPGTYTIDGKAVDSINNESETCSATIEIAAANDTPLPICSAMTVTPTEPGINTPVNVTVLGQAGVNATISEFTVDFDDGDTSVITNATLPISYAYKTTGTYLLTASVTNSKGKTSKLVCTKSIDVGETTGNGSGDDDSDDDNDTGDTGDNTTSSTIDGFDCDENGQINILDFSCFNNSYGKTKTTSGDWE